MFINATITTALAAAGIALISYLPADMSRVNTAPIENKLLTGSVFDTKADLPKEQDEALLLLFFWPRSAGGAVASLDAPAKEFELASAKPTGNPDEIEVALNWKKVLFYIL
ncbi:hypothetical protein GFM44_23220 [Rhizobium leguminosarum bv. viciae]|nr:hypothetical protein [Rhizobium leguminosarum bv. viciae]